MADFCKQCSVSNFGEDHRDLADDTMADDHVKLVICEGCGMTYVNKEGECVTRCLHNHGRERNRADLL